MKDLVMLQPNRLDIWQQQRGVGDMGISWGGGDVSM